MFERFVLPDLDTIFSTMDHAFYHLDGKGQIPHLDMLLSLESLKGIQWISGGGQPPTEEWPDLLRRIRDGGKFCQVYVSAEGARTIVRELGGKGFILYVIGPNTAEAARDFLKTLAEEDISRSH
jgi:5-methyltetrahydrofolate--homocysteine methyltransferase